MFNNYLYSKNGDGSIGKTSGPIFVIGRVKSVVLGEFTTDGKRDPNYRAPIDIGKITFEIMYSNMNLSKATGMTEPAYPMFMPIKQFPLVSELVLVVPGPDSNLNDDINNRSYFYFPPYSVWNNTQHGVFPNLDEWANYINSVGGYSAAAGQYPALPMGKTFEEKRDVRKSQPFEGDTILEGRFGQSIRFGSTVVGNKTRNNWSRGGKNGNPITIIRNGQGAQETTDYFATLVEDVNQDPASIWLTSDQSILFSDLGDFPLASYYGQIPVNVDVAFLAQRGFPVDSISAAEADSTVIVPGTNENILS